MRTGNKRGNSVVELAMFLPIFMMLLVGMYQIAQITYTYYTLRKAVYAAATFLSTEQGVNFCQNPGDLGITAAISFGLTGTTDPTQPAVVAGLTADMIVVTPQSYDPVAQAATAYVGDSLCGASTTIPSPDFITVSVNGFTVQPVIPFFSTIQPFSLSPQVQVPYGGT